MGSDKHFVDFHTHISGVGALRAHTVYSVSLVGLGREELPVPFTVGLHPWDTDRPDAYKLVEHRLPEALGQGNCLAVGEIGLDRLRGADLRVQLELLFWQLSLAQRYSKPVVLHCVRAWSELEGAIRDSRFRGRVALHGFRGRCSSLQHALSLGWYVSVKPAADGSLPAELLSIPEGQLLLETDGVDVPIEEVYLRAARARGASVSLLQQAVMRNVTTFFNTTV